MRHKNLAVLPPLRSTRCQKLSYAVLLGVVGAAMPAGRAGATTWLPGLPDGFYDDGTNWIGGSPPSAADSFEVILGGGTVIRWRPATGDTTSASMTITNTSDVFLVNDAPPPNLPNLGHTVTGNAVVEGGSLLRVGGGTSANQMELTVDGQFLVHEGAGLQVRESSRVQASSLFLGLSGNATVQVTGTGAELDVTGATIIGNSGTSGTLTFENGSRFSELSGGVFLGTSPTSNSVGTMNVLSQSFVTAGSISLGTSGLTGSRGTIQIDSDAGTPLNSQSHLGQSGSATLTVGAASGSSGLLFLSDTGRFSSGTGLTTVNPTGQIVSEGTYTANGDVEVNGGIFQQDGTLTLGIGRKITASNNGQLDFGSNFFLGNTSTIEVNSDADFRLDGSLFIGSGGAGTLVVDGAGSTLTTNVVSAGTARWADNGGSANVTFRNNASIDVGSTNIDFATEGANAATATVNIQTGADVLANTLNIATGNNGTATVNIDGAGSTLALSGSSAFNLGGAGGSTANINLTNGGALFTGTGTSTINATGTLDINGGTYNGNGDLNINGGTLTRTSGTFNLASNRELAASNNAQVTFTGSYGIANNTQFTLSDGADLTVTGFLDVGSGSTGNLFIEGAGTTVTTNTTDTTFLDWARGGAAGAVFVIDGAQATFNASRIDIAVTGGAGTSGSLAIASGGTMTANTINLATGSDGSASILVTDAGSSLTLNGTSALNIGGTGNGIGNVILQNNGLLTTGTGTTTVNATGTVFLDGGNLRAATIDHTHGGAFNFNSGTLGVETFNGNLTNAGGNLAPGGTPGDTDTFGTTTIDGDYTQQADATLALEFFSNQSPGTTHDTLDVNGHFAIGGTLQLDFAPDGFAYAVGQRVDLVDWDTRSGSFDQIVLFTLNTDEMWNTQDLYTTGEVSIEIAGDLNTDGFIGVEDLDILLANWGQATHQYNFAGGDTSGDGIADAADLAIIQANWGDGTPPGNVPEPGSLAVLGLMLLGIARRRRP